MSIRGQALRGRTSSWQLMVLFMWIMLTWMPPASAQPTSRVLTLDGTEEILDLQPWLELRRTSSDTGLEDILAGTEAWTAASNYHNMHFGYSDDALWMKISIQSAAPRDMLWHFYFPYSSLSRVVLYEGGKPERVSGLGVPLAERDFPHRNAVFTLRLTPGEQTTLYLRAESVGSLGVTSQLWSGAAFASHSVSSTAMIALYCGLLLGLGIYHLLVAGLLRDSNYLLYGFHLLLFALAVTAFSGLGGRYLWPGAGEWGTRLLPFGLTAANACALWLIANLFTERSHPSVWRVLLGILAWTSAAFALASLLLSPVWASRAIPWLAITSTLFAVACLARAARQKLPASRPFLLGACFVALGVMLFSLRAIGAVPALLLTDLAIRGFSAVSLLTIAFALASHTQWQTRLQLFARDTRLDTLQAAHNQAQRRLQDAAEQLEEIKLKLRNAELEDPLTGLANRTALERHLNYALRRSRRRHAPLAVMLIDLDGFKPLTDQLGEETANRILCVVADRLARAARDSDFVARVGGDEFVLVAEEVSGQEQARVIAERLLDTLLPSIELEGQSIAVGISMGVTLTHAADLDVPQLLRQADMARYSRQRSGRGGVSFHPAQPVNDNPD